MTADWTLEEIIELGVSELGGFKAVSLLSFFSIFSSYSHMSQSFLVSAFACISCVQTVQTVWQATWVWQKCVQTLQVQALCVICSAPFAAACTAKPSFISCPNLRLRHMMPQLLGLRVAASTLGQGICPKFKGCVRLGVRVVGEKRERVLPACKKGGRVLPKNHPSMNYPIQ